MFTCKKYTKQVWKPSFSVVEECIWLRIIISPSLAKICLQVPIPGNYILNAKSF